MLVFAELLSATWDVSVGSIKAIMKPVTVGEGMGDILAILSIF